MGRACDTEDPEDSGTVRPDAGMTDREDGEGCGVAGPLVHGMVADWRGPGWD